MGELIEIPIFSEEDYYYSTDPYEWLHNFKGNPLKEKQYLGLMANRAAKIGVRNFRSLYAEYQKTLNIQNGNIAGKSTDFTDQPIELETGSWIANDSGIVGIDKTGYEIIACNHPIMPTRRLVNIDTGIEKLELAYRKGKGWRKVICDKRTLASANSIVSLADYGIAVNSENAKHLVRYLTDIEHENFDRIEEVNSVGRLGWIDEESFSPYTENLVFDGDLSFKHFFESVGTRGDYDTWLNLCREIRKKSVLARLMLSASFSSVLIEPCGALPFFVHLWGGTEAGKTVGLMLAASVWANPEMGKYIHTFNSTAVAQELSASFVNSLPLILDELQIVKDRKDFDKTIYQLTEGVGRSRGQKTGGLQRLSTWNNCILTTGEMPIGGHASGGGAVNRIIEIDCKGIKLFDDPVSVANTVKKNFGFAGKRFVTLLQVNECMEHAIEIQKEIYKQLANGETTEKQALSASIVLTADQLIEEWIFKDGIRTTINEIEPFLFTKSQVSQNERVLEDLYDYIAINIHKFEPKDNPGEIWGTCDNDYIYIINKKFNEIINELGYNPTAFLSWSSQNGITEVYQGKNSKVKKINGTNTRCIWVKARSNEENEDLTALLENDTLPFG